MSKFTLAAKLADELGVSIAKATRFIDDVGYTRAAKLVDEGAAGADDAGGLLGSGVRLPDDWWKAATAGSVVVGGTATAWRYLDVEQAKRIAEQAEAESQKATTVSDAVRLVLEDDSLTPQQRAELLDRFLASTSGATANKNDEGAGGFLGNDVQTLVVLLIVLALVFNYAMEDD